MSKEWLEFLGGLFVFLAALIPVFRGMWRALRRKLPPRAMLTLTIFAASTIIVVCSMIEMYRGENPGLVALGWASFLILQIVVFWIDDAPMKRRDIALLLLMSLAASAEITAYVQKSDELRKAKQSAPKSETSLAPSN